MNGYTYLYVINVVGAAFSILFFFSVEVFTFFCCMFYAKHTLLFGSMAEKKIKTVNLLSFNP